MCVFRYKFKQIENMKDALKSSVKASLRLDDEGLLSLQLMIPGNNNKGKASDAFIEFRVRIHYASLCGIVLILSDWTVFTSRRELLV